MMEIDGINWELGLPTAPFHPGFVRGMAEYLNAVTSFPLLIMSGRGELGTATQHRFMLNPYLTGGGEFPQPSLSVLQSNKGKIPPDLLQQAMLWLPVFRPADGEDQFGDIEDGYEAVLGSLYMRGVPVALDHILEQPLALRASDLEIKDKSDVLGAQIRVIKWGDGFYAKRPLMRFSSPAVLRNFIPPNKTWEWDKKWRWD